MVAEEIIVILALTAGIAGGVWTPLLGWLGSDEKLNPKKFAHAVLTCTISGLVFGVAALQAIPVDGAIALAVFWFGVFFLSSGVDFTRNKIGNMVRATPAT